MGHGELLWPTRSISSVQLTLLKYLCQRLYQMLSQKNALPSVQPSDFQPQFGGIQKTVRVFCHFILCYGYILQRTNQHFIVIYRFYITGACLARCSQPEVGWLGWRSTNDENLVKAIADACAFDRAAAGSNKKIFKLNSNKPHSDSDSNCSHPSSLSTLSNEKVLKIQLFKNL